MIDTLFPAGRSPLELGYTFPAEWEEQACVYLSWPCNPETWTDCFAAMESSYADFAAAISRCELLRIIVPARNNQRIAELISDHRGRLEQIEFFDIETDDAWCRDHGPVFLRQSENGRLAMADFRYNAWGGKFSWERDNAVPSQIARYLHCRRFAIPFVCEGGALETNGAGTLLTTRSVQLNPNRNGKITESEAEQILCHSLGMRKILWLDSGLPGDDTDGHIDTLARFVRRDTVLAARANPNHPGYETLERNFQALRQMRNADGEKLEVIPLPMPDPVYPKGWRTDILPATYANYLLINGAILFPVYRQEASAEAAMHVLHQAFPEREIIPVDCYDILLEGGALHCLSQQQPKSGMVSNSKNRKK